MQGSWSSMGESLSSLLDDSDIPQVSDYNSEGEWLCAILDKSLQDTAFDSNNTTNEEG